MSTGCGERRSLGRCRSGSAVIRGETLEVLRVRCGASPCFGEEVVVNEIVLVFLFGLMRAEGRRAKNKTTSR